MRFPTTLRFLAALLLVLGAVARADSAILKNVQSGSITLTAGNNSAVTAITGVNLSQSFLVFTAGIDNSEPQYAQISGSLTSPTSVQFRRNTGVNSPIIPIHYFVAEFLAGVTVQSGSATILGSTLPVVLPQPVNLAQSFVILSQRNQGTDFDGGNFVRGKLTTSTTLTLDINGSGNAQNVVEWQVVDYAGCNVQSGDVSFSPAQTLVSAAVSPISFNRAMMFYTYRTDTGFLADIGSRMIEGEIAATNRLDFIRNNAGTTVDLTYQLVEFNDGSLAQTGPFGTAGFGGASFFLPVESGRSIITAGGLYHRGGSTPYNIDDNPGAGGVMLSFAAPSTIQISARGPFGVPVTVGFFATQFAGLPVTVQAGPNNPAPSTQIPGSTVPAMQVRLTNQASEAVSLGSFSFYPLGSGNDSTAGIAQLRVWRDVDGSGTVNGSDVQIGAGTYPANDSPTTIVLAELMAPSQVVDFLLEYAFAPGAPTGTYFTSMDSYFNVRGSGMTSGAKITARAAYPLFGSTITLVTPTPTPTATPPAPGIANILPPNGPTQGGYPVTIFGVNFLGTPSVTFGGNLAPPVSSSPTTLVVMAPAGSGVGVPVVVTAAGGPSNPHPFNYDPPNIASLVPSSGSSAGGYPVTINGTNFQPGIPSVTFGGSPAGVSPVSANQLIATAPAGSGAVMVVVSLAGQISNSVPFTYLAPTPTATPTATPACLDRAYGTSYDIFQTSQFALDNAANMYDVRFTLLGPSRTANRVYIWCNLAGTSPVYEVGIQADNGSGRPSGTYLSSTAQALAATTNLVDIPPIALTSGQIYHLVIRHQSGTINASNYAVFNMITPLQPYLPYDNSPDPNANCLTYSGSVWSVMDRVSNYSIRFTDTSLQGMPLMSSGGANICVLYQESEAFTALNTQAFDRIAVKLAKVGTPADDLRVYVVNTLGAVTLTQGVIPQTSVSASASWVTANVPLATINAGIAYRLILESNGSDPTFNYYAAVPGVSAAGAPELASITYDGNTARNEWSSDGGLAWFPSAGFDMLFQLSCASVPTATPTRTFTATATRTPTSTPSLSATPTRTPSFTSTHTATLSPSFTPTFTPTATPSFTLTPIPTATSSATGTNTPIPTATFSPTATSSPTGTNTPIPTSTSTPTPSPTQTFTPVPPSPTPSSTPTRTFTPVPSPTPSNSPTRTNTPTVTLSPTITQTPQPTRTSTITPTPAQGLTLDSNLFNPAAGPLGMDVKVVAPGTVRIKVFNIVGEQVSLGENVYPAAGNYRIQWTGKNRNGTFVGNGVYMVMIETPAGRSIRKVIVLK